MDRAKNLNQIGKRISAKIRSDVMRRTLRLNGSDVDVLRVPFMYQAEGDSRCIPFSLLMCLSYFTNIYESSVVKKNTPIMNIDDILKLTKTKILGTIVDARLINRLNESIRSLQFEFRLNCSIDDLKRSFEKDIPSIVLYDCSYLVYDIPGTNHAGVVVGLDDDKIVLNNPWMGPNYYSDIEDFQRSWELEKNRAILINPVKQENLEAYGNENRAN